MLAKMPGNRNLNSNWKMGTTNDPICGYCFGFFEEKIKGGFDSVAKYLLSRIEVVFETLPPVGFSFHKKYNELSFSEHDKFSTRKPQI